MRHARGSIRSQGSCPQRYLAAVARRVEHEVDLGLPSGVVAPVAEKVGAESFARGGLREACGMIWSVSIFSIGSSFVDESGGELFLMALGCRGCYMRFSRIGYRP